MDLSHSESLNFDIDTMINTEYITFATRSKNKLHYYHYSIKRESIRVTKKGVIVKSRTFVSSSSHLSQLLLIGVSAAALAGGRGCGSQLVFTS